MSGSLTHCLVTLAAASVLCMQAGFCYAVLLEPESGVPDEMHHRSCGRKEGLSLSLMMEREPATSTVLQFLGTSYNLFLTCLFDKFYNEVLSWK